jgi:hypothetical protein
MWKSGLIALALMVVTSLALAEGEPEVAGPAGAPAPLDISASSNEAANPTTVIVPAETEAEIQLLSGIHSEVSHVGDPITAQLISPITVNGQVALPAGSLIAGEIIRIRPAGRMRRPAEMVLRFEHVTLPDGQDQPISAILTGLDAQPRTNTQVDAEGLLKGSRAGSWKRLAGGLIGLGAFSAIQTQFASAAALGATLPIGGGAVVGYSFLWPKGNEVHLPPDTQMRIRFRNPLTVRVLW